MGIEFTGLFGTPASHFSCKKLKKPRVPIGSAESLTGVKKRMKSSPGF
jgi:hypothetical protein